MDAEPQRTGSMCSHEPNVLLVGEVGERCRRYLSGWSVTHASDGTTALGLAESDVDAMLLPRRCPDMAGETLLSKLRDRGVEAPAAVVLRDDADVSALELGFDDRLRRPLTEWKVERMLDRLVRRRTYNRLLRRYYRLVVRRADAGDPGSGPDGRTDDRIAAELRRVQDRLSTMDERMTPEEYEHLFRDLHRFVDDGEREP